MINNQPVPLKRSNRLLAGMMILCPVFMMASTGDINEGFTTSDGKYRTYLLHTPPDYDGETALPLVINLHYGGGTGAGEAAASGMSGKADAEDFIVVYPDGLGGGWSDYDTLFLSLIIDTLRGRYAIDSSKIFMTGYSAGALMSHWMACKLSGRVAAVAPVAGTMLTYDWQGCYPDDPISIISFNARNDPVVPYEGDGEYFTPVEEAMSNWAERLGCNIGPDTFYSDSGALRQTWSKSDGTCEVVLWTTEEGGHGWPWESTPHMLAGNELMWEFFMAHPLGDTALAVKEKPSSPSSPPSSPSSPRVMLDPSNAAIFSKRITISFTLASRENVSFKLYNASGSMVAAIREGVVEAGRHQAVIDASNLSRGVYFCRLSSSHWGETKKIIVVN